jgi:uncharacterized sulfatase
MAIVAVVALAATGLLDYRLEPLRVANDTYVFVGEREDFSTRNGGNIANAAFVITTEGVIVIDTGSTRRYGEAMRKAIAKVTTRPILEVWITHHHPDHFLGNQAFADIRIAALPGSTQGIREEGSAFATNVYRMAGDWAKDTEPLAPTVALEAGPRVIGDHRFQLLALKGHTAADLAVLDETTGTLFTGDLVFHDRAPTTPHADIVPWLKALDQLAALPFRVLVPGHGQPTGDAAPIVQTRAWLKWLDTTLKQAAAAGLDPSEILERPMPPEFASIALAQQELTRSIAHLFRRFETQVLRRSENAQH